MKCLIGEALSPCQRGQKNPFWLTLQFKPPAQPEGCDGWDGVFSLFQPCSPAFSVHTSHPLFRAAASSTLASPYDVPWLNPSLGHPLCFVAMWRGANTGGSILCGLVWKQSHTFSKGKASTLILRLRVCFLVTGNFFSNFPPNWQQASGDFSPSSWGCLCVCVPRAEQLSWLRFHTWGFYPIKMPTWCQTTRVPWGHTLTHLPILAQELGTCHSHWVCPGHLWALCLIVPMLLAFPRFQTLLWQPLVLLSLHLTRETSCCILSLDPVWSSHLWGQSSDHPRDETVPLL